MNQSDFLTLPSAQIAQMLCDAFDVSLDQVRADVEATVRAFREQGLLSSATDL